ncbi:MAG: T9SS type A sorting domain-containing protein [Bacteroidales bacterium]|nr:T9SS type A sorting domain-containing protein [Bacteroidales bacterium]
MAIKHKKKKKKITITILFLLCFAGVAFAQSAIVPVGGDVRNNNGSVSYTVGQIAVQRASNNGGSTAVLEGVQQPYEIMTIGVDELPQIVLNAVVYPNPTQNLAQLKLNGYVIPAGGLRAILYDGNGKQLQHIIITEDITPFQIGQYATGTYYLELRDGKRVLKTFKVIRK